MTSPSAAVPERSRRFRLSPGARWPVGYTVAALAYYAINEGYLPSGASSWFTTWIPLGTINQSLVWVMCAVGLNIVVGYAGLLDLGYVAFWAIGSYVAGWLMSTFFDQVTINILGNHPIYTSAGIHINFWFVLVIAAAFCALWGVIIGAPTLRLRSDYLALVTLGFGEIIPQFFHNADKQTIGVNISNGTQGIGPLDSIDGVQFKDSGGFSWGALLPANDLSRYLFYIILTAVVVFISLRLRVGRLGRAWLAIREDELAAGAMGVPLMRTKLAAYAVGAVAGGVAGVAFAVQTTRVLPDSFAFSNSITLLAMVVLGGMGNVWGVILGALVLSWFNVSGLADLGNTFNSTFHTSVNFTNYEFLVFGVALVLMMLFRREGFIPEARTRLVLREPGRTEMAALGSDMEQPAPDLDEIIVADEGGTLDGAIPGQPAGNVTTTSEGVDR